MTWAITSTITWAITWATRPALALLAILLSTAASSAQPASAAPGSAEAPQPLIEATLQPSTVVVGRPVRMRVRVLAPNFLTGPAQFPDLQIANAVTRPAGQTSISETRGDATFAGVMADYDIYPQEPGAFALEPAPVTLTYALDPPRSVAARLATPRLTFTATIPDAARGLDPFLATPRLSLSQSFAPAGGRFQVGDALTRTIVAEAVDLPAIFLPRLGTAAPDGIAAYPAQPRVEDLLGARGAPARGRRTEQVTYTFERPGDYALPAVALAWWDSETGRVERALLPALAVHVVPPAGGAAGDVALLRRILLALREHWLASLTAIALAVLAAIVVPRLCVRLAIRGAAWRQRETQSEGQAYRALRRAVRRGSERDIYAALLVWSGRHPPDQAMPLRNEAPGAAARRLAAEVSLLEQRLYGHGEARPWSARNLIGALRAIRREWKALRSFRPKPALPVRLNPGP